MNFVTAHTILPRVDYDVRDPFDTWVTSFTLGSGITPQWSVYTEIIEYDTELFMVVSKETTVVTTVLKDTELYMTFTEAPSLSMTFEEEVEL
jgi:hypothetical protein